MKSKIAPIAGLSASIVLYSAIFIATTSYVGQQGESYSFFNHFISDLGNIYVSKHAFIFNTGVIISGIGYAIFAYTMWGFIKSKLAKFSVVLGIIASILCSGVGLVPTHCGAPHFVIALSFFILMTMAMGLYSVSIWQAPKSPLPNYTALYGFCAPITFVIFIMMPKDLMGKDDELGPLFNRPDFWGLAFFEWVVFLVLTTWVVLVSLQLLWLQYKFNSKGMKLAW